MPFGTPMTATTPRFLLPLDRSALDAAMIDLDGTLVRLFGTDVASPHAYYLCWRTGIMDRWECAAFAEWLRKILA